MGTNADFYVGPTVDGWLGSIAYDGYPRDKGEKSGVPLSVLSAKTEATFRRAVARLLDSLESATKPDQGWPWRWEDSSTSCYGYAFFRGRVWVAKKKDVALKK